MQISTKNGRLIVRLTAGELRHIGLSDAKRPSVRLSIEGAGKFLAVRADPEGRVVQKIVNSDPFVCCMLKTLGLDPAVADSQTSDVKTRLLARSANSAAGLPSTVLADLPWSLLSTEARKAVKASSTDPTKRLTMSGRITNLIRRPTAAGTSFATFRLLRAGHEPVRCVAFGAAAEYMLRNRGNDQLVNIWGMSERTSFKNRKGQTEEYDRFRVLKSFDFDDKKAAA